MTSGYSNKLVTALWYMIKALFLLPFVVLRSFVLSPWGLVAPITFIVLIFALEYVKQTPQQLADYYAVQFADCDDSDIPNLMNVMLKLGDAGIDGLVQGLTSDREAVFNACRHVLQDQFEQHGDEHFCALLSAALLKHCDYFQPVAKYEAVRLTEQILARRTSPNKAVLTETTSNCEKLLIQLNNSRRKMIDPNRPETAAQSATVASVNRRTVQPELVAANGKKFIPANIRRESAGDVVASVDRLSVPRAERIATFQRSGAVQNEVQSTEYDLQLAQVIPAVAETGAKIGSRYQAAAEITNINPMPDIGGDYRNEKKINASGTDGLVPVELQHTPLGKVPDLQPAQLMMLLHHPDPNYISAAKNTLTHRDGFQETHLKLAWRLYHPSPVVRREIIEMLPHTANVQPDAWMSVLLNDPNNDVRYQAASFLATSTEPALQKLLLEHAKRDTDSRIINLADRLLERQHNVRR
jgi:hypothetical protein